ncbi:MAG: DUF962 domain-containing protein [Gammaproteobacteria bacterium]|nr:DUF962 domain-containing protein [Gammaproteobacteria bacterium]
MNARLVNLMRDYRHYHVKAWTVYSHFIGIPVVTFSVLIFFSWFQFSLTNIIGINLAWLGIIILAIFYISLDRAIGIVTTIGMILLGWLVNVLSPDGLTLKSFILFLVTFILGWVFQLVGHVIEGRKPALLDNFVASVFIAPLFIVAEVFFRLGSKKDLQAAIK